MRPKFIFLTKNVIFTGYFRYKKDRPIEFLFWGREDLFPVIKELSSRSKNCAWCRQLFMNNGLCTSFMNNNEN